MVAIPGWRWRWRALARAAAVGLFWLQAVWMASSGWAGAAPQRTAADPGAPVIAAAPELAARVIVAYRRDAQVTRQHPWSPGALRRESGAVLQRRADALAAHAGRALVSGRAVGRRAQVVRAAGVSSQALAQRLASHPDVAWVAIDGWRRAFTAPNDGYYAAGPAVVSGSGGPEVGQWYLRQPDATFVAAINAETAWSRSTGQGVVVAVLDTGVRFDHPDLGGSRLLQGYDMVRDAAAANDGDGGRDSDASDPGDFITEAEANTVGGPFFGGAPRHCADYDPLTRRYRAVDSSWHGTEVVGLLGAVTNNGFGIAGVAHGAQILPVRVLGKCGGYDSDIQAGIYWAAGIEQPGLPANPTPARVINLSLGGAGTCSQDYQDAIDEVTARGVVVVAAAGNSASDSVGTPANCQRVIAVTGLRHAGTKVGFSALGPQIAIAAPGGNCVNIQSGQPCLYPLLTTTNLGLAQPGASGFTDSFRISVGTSFSAPLVSGAAAMILSLRPDWGQADVLRALQSSARAFPEPTAGSGVVRCPALSPDEECHCSTALCGAGMLDIDAALALTVASPRPAPGGASGGGAADWGWLAGLAAASALMSARRLRGGRRRGA
jgi:serine protease